MLDLTGKGYDVRETIGDPGGFGTIYRAYQPGAKREVAIKVMLPQHAANPEFIRRFEQEAELIARLEHPHIVPLYNYWTDDTGLYLVLRLVRGGSLRARLKQEGAFSLQATARLLDQVAGALALAHRNQVIHRDLKPENILIDEDGNAYLTDFGIAKDFQQSTSLTQAEAFLGTSGYAPLEQMGGDTSIRSDIFSLGIILYEMLTGTNPFMGSSQSETINNIVTMTLPSLRESMMDFPAELDEVLQKATAKDPNQRYASALDIATEFRRAMMTNSRDMFLEVTTDWISPWSVTGRADFYRHIALPPNYVPRADLLTEVRSTLIASDNTLALTSAIKSAIALHGMGGIGKSVMARALCVDHDVQVMFPDGILWTTLGQEPNLLSKLREWVNVLGGHITENVPTVDSLKALLAELLEDRACLLIVDDVWQKKHAEVFRVGAKRCRLLLTTRDAEIARSVGASVTPIPTMSEAEAVTLLRGWADGNLDDTNPELINRIVRELGRLPLALKLAGAQLQRTSPERWLQRFDISKLKEKRGDEDDPHSSLERCFGMSLSELKDAERKLYAALAIFKQDEPIREQAITRLWSVLDDLDADEVEDLLDDLAARALLEVAGDKYPRAAVLHDLLRDFITAELDDPMAAHTALLEAYRETQTDDGWHTAPDDGYLYENLAYHLSAVSDIPAIRRLFRDQAWMNARVPTDDWRYDGYLQDLDVYWQYAEARAEGDNAPAAFADCLRCALIHTSINSLAASYPPELVARAVEIELWSPERALSVAAQVPQVLPKQEARAKLYVALLGTGMIKGDLAQKAQKAAFAAVRDIEHERMRADTLIMLAPFLPPDLLGEALAVARNIGDERHGYERMRAEALIGLAPFLPPDLLGEALAVARNIGDERHGHERMRAEALIGLAPFLPPDLLGEALAVARNFGDERYCTEALIGLAPHLPSDLLEEALATARHIEEGYNRARALTAVAPYLPPGQRSVVLREALIATRNIVEDKWDRADTLIMLFPHLPTDLLGEALAVARNIEDEVNRAEVVTALAPYLPPDLLEQALIIVHDIEAARLRTDCLSALASHLPSEQQSIVLGEALIDLRNIGDESDRAKALIRLAPYLPSDLLKEALATVRDIGNKRTRTDTLIMLAPHLPDLLRKVLAVVRNIGDQNYRVRTLITLAPHLPPDLMGEALAVARDIGHEHTRARALLALVPHLPPDLLREALVVIRNIGHEYTRVETLTALAPHLPAEQQSIVLREALIAVHNIGDERTRARSLLALVPHLPPDLLREVLVVIRNIGNKYTRTRILIILAPHLPSDLLEQALKIVRNIEDECADVGALASLTPHLTAEQQSNVLGNALISARNIESEGLRSEALTVLTPHLPPDLLEQVLMIARNIEDAGIRAGCLSALVSYLPAEQQSVVLGEALVAARSIEFKYNRASALQELTPHLPAEQQSVVLREALIAVYDIKDTSLYADALTWLAPHLPPDLLHEALIVTRSIENVDFRAEALIALAPLLPPDLLREALTVAHDAGDEGLYAELLIRLAPHPPPDLLREILVTVRNIGPEWNRVKALIGLAPHLPLDLLGEALAATRNLAATFKIGDKYTRTAALIRLAPHLPPDLLGEALAIARNIEEKYACAEAMIGLVPHLPAEQQSVVLGEALVAVSNIVDERTRATTLRELAPHLPPDLLQEALIITRSIEGEYYRAEALAALFPHLTGQEEELQAEIRAAMIIRLRAAKTGERKNVLNFCQDKSLFAPPILPVEVLQLIAEYIFEICYQWEWL